MVDELLPCPFCNNPVANDPVISSAGEGYSYLTLYYWWIECEHCNLTMEEWFNHNDDPNIFREILVKKWNTRNLLTM